MLDTLHESCQSVDRYLREHSLVYAATLVVVTALVWVLAGMALGDAPETTVIEGVAFGVAFATVTLIGRRIVSADE